MCLIRSFYKEESVLVIPVQGILTSGKMIPFQSILILAIILQASFVRGFLLNPNTSHPLHSSVSSSGNGYDATILSYLLQKVDRLQNQIQEQNKAMEEQANVIQKLLNLTQQSPSTVSLGNDISILQMYVRQIMDQYQKLSNISDATDLALKINSMAHSVEILTSSLTIQGNRMNQMDNEFKEQISTLNGSLHSAVYQSINHDHLQPIESKLSVFNKSLASLHQQSKNLEDKMIDISNQTISTYLLKNELSVLELTVQRVLDEYHRLAKNANTTHLEEKISSMAYTLHGVSKSLIDNKNEMNQLDARFGKEIDALNRTILNISLTLHQLSLDTNSSLWIQQSLATVSSLGHYNSQLTKMTEEIQSAKTSFQLLEQQVFQNHRNISNLTSTVNMTYYALQMGALYVYSNISSMDTRIHNLEVDDGSSKLFLVSSVMGCPCDILEFLKFSFLPRCYVH